MVKFLDKSNIKYIICYILSIVVYFFTAGIIFDNWKEPAYDLTKNNKDLASGLTIALTFLTSYGIYYYKYRKLTSNNIFDYWAFNIIIPLSIVVLILFLIYWGETYSRTLVFLYTFMMIGPLVFLSLYINFMKGLFDSKEKENLKDSKKWGFYAGFASLIIWAISIVFLSKQEINRGKFSDNVDKPVSQDEDRIKYINFIMLSNSVLFGIFLMMFIYISYDKTNKSIQNIHRIFFPPKKETNIKDLKTKYSSIAIFVLYTLIALFYWMIISSQFHPDKEINPDTATSFIWILILLVPSGLSFVEASFNNLFGYSGKEGFQYNQMYTIQFFRYFLLFIFLFQPLIGMAIYNLYKPTTFREINNANIADVFRERNLLVFSDKGENNLSSSAGSIFSVHTATANYGNGVYVAGGRSNLDLETTRGIRYVGNDSHYYNLKYMDGDHFVEIEREDDLNLFSLQTNDISYGVGTKGGLAYWVAVGENVGLTEGNVSSIFYNNTAGTNDTKTYVPDISELNNWSPAESGAFEYKGNGVVSASLTGVNWVAVGQDKEDLSGTVNNIKYSADGKNWNSSLGGGSFSGYGNKVAYKPTKTGTRFVAVGYDRNGTDNILHSTDGKNWTAVAGFAEEGHDVAYGLLDNTDTGLWVAVGSDAATPIKYSTDGTTWKNDAKGFIFSGPDQALAVTYNLKDRKFYVTGRASNNQKNYIYESSNGKNWTLSSRGQINSTVDSATAIATIPNVGLDNNNDYNKVYYPTVKYQNYFKKEVSSISLTYFINFIYVMSTIIFTLFIYLVFKNKIDKKSTTLDK